MLFTDLPIQQKLMRVIFLISGVVLLVTCVTFFAYEYYTFRQTTVEKLSTLGKIISSNSTAALAFENHDDAKEILTALKAEPHIVAACLYDKDGNLFAQYPANHDVAAFPVKPGETEGFRFIHSHLEGFQPVLQVKTRLGTLYLKSDLGAMYERFQLYGIIVGLVMLVSFFLAYQLSSTLQKSISRPILALAETAKIISDQQNYSVRATKIGKDELGSLTDAFNQMLEQIQAQNQVLSEFNQNLEQKIEERTRELKESEDRFRLVVDSVKDYAIFVVDTNGYIAGWNQGAEHIKGYSAEEVIGKNISIFYTKEEIEQGEPEHNLKIAREQGRYETEGWRVRKDGSKFWADVVFTPIYDSKGVLQGFSKITRDITERKRAEERIKDQTWVLTSISELNDAMRGEKRKRYWHRISSVKLPRTWVRRWARSILVKKIPF